jgi:predicted Zn-dependent protease
LSIDRDHFAARLGQGIVNFKSGKLAEAGVIFSALKKDIPDDQEASWWLGRIAEKRGDFPTAIGSYKDTVMLGGEGPAIHLRLLRLYIITGNFYRAREEMKRFFHMLKRSFR